MVFLDDDMLVDRVWLGAIVAQLRRRGPGWAVTGQVREGAAERVGAFQMSVLADTTPREYPGRLLRDVLYTGKMAISRELLERVGEFDERLGAGSRFPGAEDNDFGYRLLAHGARIAYAPDAAVQHRAWRPREAYVRMRWGYGPGQGGSTPSMPREGIASWSGAPPGTSRTTSDGSLRASSASRSAPAVTSRSSPA
jgi:hypothetical protein